MYTPIPATRINKQHLQGSRVLFLLSLDSLELGALNAGYEPPKQAALPSLTAAPCW